MVEIQKPKSALKTPSVKRETVVVNNSAPMKKVTLVAKDEVSTHTHTPTNFLLLLRSLPSVFTAQTSKRRNVKQRKSFAKESGECGHSVLSIHICVAHVCTSTSSSAASCHSLRGICVPIFIALHVLALTGRHKKFAVRCCCYCCWFDSYFFVCICYPLSCEFFIATHSNSFWSVYICLLGWSISWLAKSTHTHKKAHANGDWVEGRIYTQYWCVGTEENRKYLLLALGSSFQGSFFVVLNFIKENIVFTGYEKNLICNLLFMIKLAKELWTDTKQLFSWNLILENAYKKSL